MKAMILAAGIGSRLKELTHENPKALVEFQGKPMLEHVITKLKNEGVCEIAINIHHKGDKILDYLDRKKNFGVNIYISDERDELLNTGGAILKAKQFIVGEEPVLIHNVDIISDVRFSKLLQFHESHENIATLCTRNRTTSRYLLFSKNNRLVGWQNEKTGEIKWTGAEQSNYKQLAYSGIYLINPEFVNNINNSGNFSIIDIWLEMASAKPIMGFEDDSGVWYDLGTIERIKTAENKER